MPRPQHALQRLPIAESPLTRLATLLAVGALGAAALASTAPTAGSGLRLSAGRVDAPASSTSHSTLGAVHEARPTLHTPPGPQAAKTTMKRPAHAAPAAGVQHAAAVHAPARYIPTGTGIWIYEWRRSNRGDPHSIVARARRAHLSTIYLRTGSSWDGLSGAAHLRRLLSAARGTGVHVVAWDFPRLGHPCADAHRLARAARIRTAAGLRVSAVAPDIETPAEGTFNAAWRVRLYLQALRHYLPADVSIITAVPWPSRFRIADYPYGIVAAHSDVLVPMAYWYNNRPDQVTARSIGYLRRFHRPVQPVGQGYDGRLDVPGLRHNNLSRQVPAFFRTAHRNGASAVSLWSWQAAPPVAWRALASAHRLFPAGR